MNQTNQIRGESQQYKLLCEAFENQTKWQRYKTVLNGFNEGKNYNPMDHRKWHNQIKTMEKYKSIHVKMVIETIYSSLLQNMHIKYIQIFKCFEIVERQPQSSK